MTLPSPAKPTFSLLTELAPTQEPTFSLLAVLAPTLAPIQNGLMDRPPLPIIVGRDIDITSSKIDITYRRYCLCRQAYSKPPGVALLFAKGASGNAL